MSENKKAKHFTCFCCSEMFDTLEEFRIHITTSHEEGIDYIACPIKDCQIPVRDLRTHYATKHPEQQIPPGQACRPTIIRDTKSFKKKRSTVFKSGDFFSKKNNKILHFRSGFECEFYKILEKKRDVARYSAESLVIEYHFQGGMHRYYPDILVEYTNGKKQVWEIKPKNQTKLPKNLAKWQAANEYCRKRNMEFVVLTEKALRMMKKGLI
jgi:hypothetical protein